MSTDAEDLKTPECPACGFLVFDYEPGISSVVREGQLWHPDCAPSSEPTHISVTIDDVLLAADTPAEILEDATGWTKEPEPEEEGFPVRQYTDAEIDEMLLEENATVRCRFIERATSHLRWIERSGIEQVQSEA